MSKLVNRETHQHQPDNGFSLLSDRLKQSLDTLETLVGHVMTSRRRNLTLSLQIYSRLKRLLSLAGNPHVSAKTRCACGHECARRGRAPPPPPPAPVFRPPAPIAPRPDHEVHIIFISLYPSTATHKSLLMTSSRILSLACSNLWPSLFAGRFTGQLASYVAFA